MCWRGWCWTLQDRWFDPDGGRARHEPTCQAEHDDLSGCHLAVGKTAPDVVGMRQFVRVLVTRGGGIQAVVVFHGMVMVVRHEFHVIAMAVIFMAQKQAGNEFMGFGHLLCGFDEAVALGEAKRHVRHSIQAATPTMSTAEAT